MDGNLKSSPTNTVSSGRSALPRFEQANLSGFGNSTIIQILANKGSGGTVGLCRRPLASSQPSGKRAVRHTWQLDVGSQYSRF